MTYFVHQLGRSFMRTSCRMETKLFSYEQYTEEQLRELHDGNSQSALQQLGKHWETLSTTGSDTDCEPLEIMKVVWNTCEVIVIRWYQMPLAPRLAAHLNSTMQPVEGNTAAIRDDLRQIFAPWPAMVSSLNTVRMMKAMMFLIWFIIYNPSQDMSKSKFGPAAHPLILVQDRLGSNNNSVLNEIGKIQQAMILGQVKLWQYFNLPFSFLSRPLRMFLHKLTRLFQNWRTYLLDLQYFMTGKPKDWIFPSHLEGI